MTLFVFPPSPQPSLTISDSDERFPVHRIYCVGRNYAAHAREMGQDPDREPPFFFTKSSSCLVDQAETIPYPPKTDNFHYETELVLAIGKEGTNIRKQEAFSHIWGAAVGLDMTRRDLQKEAKEKGHPWDMAKGFDKSAPIAPLTKITDIPSIKKGAIKLSVNGDVKQQGDLCEMIWSCDEIIASLSTLVTLMPGDLIMTGTPSGVGPVNPGDILNAEIDGLSPLKITINHV